MKITESKFSDLLKNYRKFIPYLHGIHEGFGGPSVYFHQRALLECRRNFLSETHLEFIYATLASWGMHRMGPTTTKMVNFDIFQNAIVNRKPQLQQLKDIRLADMSSNSEELFKEIEDLCFSLKVSTSNSRIVGNSKTLAHILPDLVPPIDRQYTIRFFANSLSNFQDGNEERLFFNHILKRNYQLISIIKQDHAIKIDTIFNTSYPKVIDNLIMAYIKNGGNGA
jgi:hypothetical protein